MPGISTWTPGRKFFVYCTKADGITDRTALAEAHNKHFGRDAPKIVKNAINYCLSQFKECISWPIVPNPRQKEEEDWENLSSVEFLRLYKAWKIAVHQQRMSSASSGQIDSTVITPSQIYHALYSPGPSQSSPAAQYEHSHSGSPSGQFPQPMGHQQNGAGQAGLQQSFPPINGRPSITSQTGYPASPYTEQMGSPNQHAMSPLGIHSLSSSQQTYFQSPFEQAAGGYGNPLAPPIYHNQLLSNSSAGISSAQQKRYHQNMQSMQGMQSMPNKSAQNPLQHPRTSPGQVVTPSQRYGQSASPQNARLQQNTSQTRRSPSAPRNDQQRVPSLTQSSPLKQVLSHDGLPTPQQQTRNPSPDFLSLDKYPALQSAMQQKHPQTQPWLSPSLSATSGTTPARPQSVHQNQRPSPNQSQRLPPNKSSGSVSPAALVRNVHQSPRPPTNQFSSSAPGTAPAQNVDQTQRLPKNQFSAPASGVPLMQNTSSNQKPPVAPFVQQVPTFLQGQEYKIDEGVIYLSSPTFYGPVNIPPQAEGWGVTFPEPNNDQPEPDCVISGPTVLINMFMPQFLGGMNIMGDLPASAYASVPKVPIVPPASMRVGAPVKVTNPSTPPSRKRTAEEDIQEAEVKRQKFIEETITREQQTPTPPAPAPVQTPRMPTPITPAPVANMTAATASSPVSALPKDVTQATADIKQTATPTPTWIPEDQVTPFDIIRGPPYPAQTRSPFQDKDNSTSPVPVSPNSKKPYVADDLVNYTDLDVPFGYQPNKPVEEERCPTSSADTMYGGEFFENPPEWNDIFARPARSPPTFYMLDGKFQGY